MFIPWNVKINQQTKGRKVFKMSITLNLNEQQKIEILSQILTHEQVVAVGTLILDSNVGKVHEQDKTDKAVYTELFEILAKVYQEQSKNNK